MQTKSTNLIEETERTDPRMITTVQANVHQTTVRHVQCVNY